MFLLSLVFSAHAANYTVTFCADYSIDFDDADLDVGDDYIRENTDRSARGAWLVVRRNSDNHPMYNTYTDWDGASPGCTTGLVLDSNESYTVSLKSRALVNGNYINVLDNDTNDLLYTYVPYTAFVPSLTTTVTFDTPLRSQWNIAASAGYGMYRRNIGLTGENYDLYTEACPSDPGASCRSGNAVYVGSGDKKYVINHELGHLLAYRRNGNQGADFRYNADKDGCYTDIGRSHEAVSKEYQSAAANEGFAHYYAAVSFNSTAESGCQFAYYKSTDWDLDTFTDDIWVSCESGPITGVDNNDYVGDWCLGSGVSDNRGTSGIGCGSFGIWIPTAG